MALAVTTSPRFTSLYDRFRSTVIRMRCRRNGDILTIRRVAGPLMDLAVRVPVDVERSIAINAVVSVELYFYPLHYSSSSSSSKSPPSSHSQQASQLLQIEQTWSTSSSQEGHVTLLPSFS